jgi:hypothetical protein
MGVDGPCVPRVQKKRTNHGRRNGGAIKKQSELSMINIAEWPTVISPIQCRIKACWGPVQSPFWGPCFEFFGDGGGGWRLT